MLRVRLQAPVQRNRAYSISPRCDLAVTARSDGRRRVPSGPRSTRTCAQDWKSSTSLPHVQCMGMLLSTLMSENMGNSPLMCVKRSRNGLQPATTRRRPTRTPSAIELLMTFCPPFQGPLPTSTEPTAVRPGLGLLVSWSDQSTYTGDTKTIHPMPATAMSAIAPISAPR